MEELAGRLDEVYRSMAARFPQFGIRIEKVKSKSNTPKTSGHTQDALVLTALETVEEPSSLRLLRSRIARRQPLIDLPELLLEIQACTDFAAEFSHVSEARSRLDDLPTSLCAVLFTEACNVGLTPLMRKGMPALERGRLLCVQQNYVRPDTIPEPVPASSSMGLWEDWAGKSE